MKLVLAITIIAFASIAVFGFIGLAHDSIFSNCAMAVMSPESSCPPEPTAEISLLHARIFQSFSVGILTVLVLLLVVLLVTAEPLTAKTPPLHICTIQNFQIASAKSHFKTKLITWLKLLAKQDALAS
ncbi:MAG: hypothetical protein HY395_02450 [Candidatus Doudnabacteria bacterium]|nr:hypothetical protein [Candidatus Doudnabacteria bacterium]